MLLDDGKLYTFGEDENGKLGTTGSKDTSRPQPVATEDGHFIAAACGSGHTVGLTKEGKVFTFGDGSRGQLGQGTRVQQLSEPKVVQQLSNLKVNFVSCGDCHTAAITGLYHMFSLQCPSAVPYHRCCCQGFFSGISRHVAIGCKSVV